MSGIFGSSQWMYNSGADFFNGVATQSLRFDNASSSHLKGTLSASFNTYTFSAWIKRSTITSSYFQYIFSSGSGGLAIGSTVSHTDKFYVYDGTTAQPTDAVYRDASGWYHVVLSSNSGTGVLYVNGVSVKTGINCASTSTTTNYTMIGYYPVTASALYFDGYMADVNFIDGTAIGDSDADGYLDEFGELKNGVWIPKAYTGSYGTNGFRLEFKQTGTGTGSTTTIGADTSGNLKHFDSSGIVASDCDMPDSPENGFATLNSTIRPYTVTPAETVSDGNLNAFFNSSAVSGSYWSTFLLTSGKWYFEVLIDAVGSNANVGISNNPEASGRGTYTAPANGYGYFYKMTGQKGINNTFTSYGATYTTNDIIGCAFDLDNDTITFYKNNVSQGQITGVAPYDANNRGFIPALTGFNGVRSVINFGQDSSFAGNETAQGNTDGNGKGDFYYSPPSGYLALCSANLPEPTISPNADTQADDYFNTVLYTGTGAELAVTGVGFSPEFVWLKKRSGAADHRLFDIIRGATKRLKSNLASAEATESESLKSFDSDGFTLGTADYTNDSGATHVSWNWKAGGTAVFNTDGTITSSVSANTDAGFSIVSYTGNATASTIGHGLNKTPSMVIVKERGGARPWVTYHASNTSAPETDYLRLNETNGTADFDMWNDTAPTSSVFSVSSYDWVNNNASPFIAYCFAEIEGYSKIGSYTGNGSTDGTFVYTGFRPAWIMMKDTDTGDWLIYDTERNLFNLSGKYLQPNNSGAEGSETNGIDILSNGFKQRNTFTNLNSSGNTYIYMSFAENPFKYSLGR